MIKIILEESVQENMTRLASTGSTRPFGENELSFGIPEAITPTQENPRNTQILATVTGVSDVQGSILVKYRRQTFEENRPSVGNTVPTRYGDSVETIKQKILAWFKLKEDQVVFGNISGDIDFQDVEVTQIGPIANSKLYAPGQFEIQIANIDQGFLETFIDDTLDGFTRTVEALATLIMDVLSGFDQEPAENLVTKYRGASFVGGDAASSVAPEHCYQYGQGLRPETQNTWGTLPETWAEWDAWYANPFTTVSITISRYNAALGSKTYIPVVDVVSKGADSMLIQYRTKADTGDVYGAWQTFSGQTIINQRYIEFKVTLEGPVPQFVFARTGFKYLN